LCQQFMFEYKLPPLTLALMCACQLGKNPIFPQRFNSVNFVSFCFLKYRKFFIRISQLTFQYRQLCNDELAANDLLRKNLALSKSKQTSLNKSSNWISYLKCRRHAARKRRHCQQNVAQVRRQRRRRNDDNTSLRLRREWSHQRPRSRQSKA